MEKQVRKSYFVPHLLLSAFLIAFWSLLLVILFYPSNNALGSAFDIAIFYMMARWVALWLALLLLVIRVVIGTRVVNSFIYVFCGTLNCSAGILAIYLYGIHSSNPHWLHVYLLNLLLGVVITGDCLLLYVRGRPMDKQM